MTRHDDFDRELADWFEADAQSPAPTAGLDRVLDATRRRRPRPTWLSGPGSQWVGEARDSGSSSGLGSLPRLGPRWSTLVIVVLVIAAIAGGAVLVGAQLLNHSLLQTDRGQLAYGLDRGIYLADEDGTDPVRIADVGPASCNADTGSLIWAPDGRYLAFRSVAGASCTGAVVVIDPTTKAVASFPGDGWQVSWSPDSTRIATWVDIFNTIGIYGVDGTRQALLTVPSGCAGGGDYDPVWSPDGASLVGRGCDVPIDGRTPQRVLATDPRFHQERAYSQDGARVAYITLGSLHVAAADGSEDRVVVASGVAYGSPLPVWSPTGDRIAFGVGAGPGDPDEIRIVDVTTGTVSLLVGPDGTYSDGLIGFSPKGDEILFSRTDANNAMSLWSVSTDGSTLRLLVSGTSVGEWRG